MGAMLNARQARMEALAEKRRQQALGLREQAAQRAQPQAPPGQGQPAQPGMGAQAPPMGRQAPGRMMGRGRFPQHQFQQDDPNWRDRFKGKIRESQVPLLMQAMQNQERNRMEQERIKIAQQRANDAASYQIRRGNTYEDRTNMMKNQAAMKPKIEMLSKNLDQTRKEMIQLQTSRRGLEFRVSQNIAKINANREKAKAMKLRRDSYTGGKQFDVALDPANQPKVDAYNQYFETLTRESLDYVEQLKRDKKMLAEFQKQSTNLLDIQKGLETQLKGSTNP